MNDKAAADKPRLRYMIPELNAAACKAVPLVRERVLLRERREEIDRRIQEIEHRLRRMGAYEYYFLPAEWWNRR